MNFLLFPETDDGLLTMELVESEMLFELYENEQPPIIDTVQQSAVYNSAYFKYLEYKRIIFPVKLKVGNDNAKKWTSYLRHFKHQNFS